MPQDAVLEDQGRMTQIQELVDKLRSEYQTESVVAHLRKKGRLNRFSGESKRTIQRLGNIELYEFGEISKNTMASVLKVLARGITILLMWSMPHAFARTKAQDQKSIGDLVYSVLRRENGLLMRSETWTEPVAR